MSIGKKPIVFSIISLLTCSMIFLAAPLHVLALGESVSIGTYQVTVGDIVDVPVRIANAWNIAGGSVKITFDKSVAIVQEVVAGDFGPPVFNVKNDGGFVHIAVARHTAVGKSEAVLAVVRFKGVREGTTTLHLEIPSLNDEKGNLITPHVTDGSLNVRREAPPLPPEEVPSPLPVVGVGSVKGRQGSVVSIQISIANVSGMAGIQFTLTYNQSVIEVKDIHKRGLIKDFIFAKNINNREGWVRVAAASATGVSGSGVIAEVEAMLVGKPGSSIALRIVDLKLNDERGRLIVAKAEEGVVEVSGGASHVVVRASNVHLLLGATGASKITLSKAPTGLAGYEIEVKLVPPPGVVDRGVADIVEVRFPEWAVLKDSSIKDGMALLKAVDIRDMVRAGDEEIELAEIVLKAKNLGEARIELRVIRMDDDNGMSISVSVERGEVVVAMGPPPIVENRHPTDPDGDDLFEDVNGNGRIDFDDVVKLFKNFDKPQVTQYFKFYDFNRNGRLDFDDIVELFRRV